MYRFRRKYQFMCGFHGSISAFIQFEMTLYRYTTYMYFGRYYDCCFCFAASTSNISRRALLCCLLCFINRGFLIANFSYLLWRSRVLTTLLLAGEKLWQNSEGRIRNVIYENPSYDKDIVLPQWYSSFIPESNNTTYVKCWNGNMLLSKLISDNACKPTILIYREFDDNRQNTKIDHNKRVHLEWHSRVWKWTQIQSTIQPNSHFPVRMAFEWNANNKWNVGTHTHREREG